MTIVEELIQRAGQIPSLHLEDLGDAIALSAARTRFATLHRSMRTIEFDMPADRADIEVSTYPALERTERGALMHLDDADELDTVVEMLRNRVRVELVAGQGRQEGP